MITPPNMPPNFGSVPVVGQKQQRQVTAIQQAMQKLSSAIYIQLATAHIGTRDAHQAVEVGQLRRLATDSMAAARAYFEGLGVVKVEGEGDSNG